MKNKSLILLVISGSLAATFPAQAVTSRVGSAQDLGFGAQFGQPFGVTAKYWMSSTLAIDGAMGYHFNHNFDAHADALWHTFSSFDVSNGRLPFYAGAGARILLGNDSQLGLRLPFGASFLPSSNPIELFAEIAPVIKIAPSLGGDVDGELGIRVYINYLK
jgi:hypothetical protein